MFLTKSQLKELTGYARPSSHMRWLAGNNYPFEVGADGYPRVLISLIERRLGSNVPLPQRRSEPRFTAI